MARFSVAGVTTGHVACGEEREQDEGETNDLLPARDGCPEAAHLASPLRSPYAQRYAVILPIGSARLPVVIQMLRATREG